MNILFICDEYPPGKHGGIGTMIQVLGRELVKQGHKVFVAGLYSYRYSEKDYEEDQGVKVWRLRYGLNPHAGSESKIYSLLEKMPDFIKYLLNGKRAFKKYIEFIQRLITKENIEVIEIQDWNSFTFFIGFKVQWPDFGIPLILKSNGSYTYFANESKTRLDPRMYAIDQALYQRADALSSVSRYTANLNRRLFHIGKNIEILYNSIDIPANTVAGERAPSTIMFTGTLLQKKGIFQLVKAWNIVNQQMPDARLLVYGKGKINPLKSLLTPQAVETVQFEGHVSRSVLNQQLSVVTAAVFPSYSECFSFAPLEAMAMGCPVINTSRSSGTELTVDHINGSLIDPDNIEQIAQKIMELINNKELQKIYSLKGRETVQVNFNIIKSAQDHVEYYQRVIKSHT